MRAVRLLMKWLHFYLPDNPTVADKHRRDAVFLEQMTNRSVKYS